MYKKMNSVSTVYSGVKFLFFFSAKLPTLFIQKQMTAVGIGQQHSQAVGLGFESLSCQFFFTIYPSLFSITEFIELLKESPTKFFGIVRQKILDGKF